MTERSHQKLSAILRSPSRSKRLLKHVWRHYREDRCFDDAASLSYTSLLSLVPLLAVIFGIAAAFPVFENWSGQFKQLVFDNLVPDSGMQVQESIEQFLGSVSALTLTGTFFLIITALLLLMRIEKTFNRIWRVTRARPLVPKITMYWAVLTLGPLTLGAATALSAQPMLELLGADALDAGLLRTLGIFLFTWLAFTLMFLLVPNCRVPLAYAATGGLVSTLLFTLAKTGFVGYVSRANYSVIYGALASIPIFLLWLYVVWGVILLGASLAASLTGFADRGSDWRWPAALEFVLVYRLLGHFYLAQRNGEALSLNDLMEREPGVTSSRLQALLHRLRDEQLISQNADENWLLARDLHHYSLQQLYLAGDYHLPLGGQAAVPGSGPFDAPLLTLLGQVSLTLDQPLAALYDQAVAN